MSKIGTFREYLAEAKVEKEVELVNESMSDDIDEIVKILKRMPVSDMPLKDIQPFRNWLIKTLKLLNEGELQFSKLEKIK